MTATVLEVAEALRDALTDVSPAFPLQVDSMMVFGPGVPTIDIYPATPAESDLTFGQASRTHWFTIRARVATSDPQGAQELLLGLRDPEGPSSVRAALLADTTFGGIADDLLFDANTPSGFYLVEDAGGASGTLRYLAEDWRVGVLVTK